MKKATIVLVLLIVNTAYSQWTENSSLISTNTTKVVIGDNTVQGNYGVNDQVLEIVSPASNSSYLTFKSGSDAMTLASGPFGNALYLPNNGSFNFAYGANNVMTINPSGNIGIGTTNPNSELEVAGEINATYGIFPGRELDYEIFADWNDAQEKSIVFAAGKSIPGSTNKRLFNIHDISMGGQYLTNGTILNMYDRSGKSRFSVAAYEGYGSSLELKNKNENIIFRASANSSDGGYVDMPDTNSKFIIGGFGNDPIVGTHKFVVKGSSLIQGNIITDSNIGIGTSSFTDGNEVYKLSVKGKVRAEEIKVYNTWADYVFNNDYKLPSLQDVEDYITKNGHLPNVPSAKEVTENGLELGEMSKIQQEKIEELTLYVIEQNKAIEKQHKDIEALKALVKTLMENN